MPRKRKSDQKSADTTSAGPEPPVPEPLVSQPADPEPKAEVPNTDGQTFAERVGQRKWKPVPDPYEISTDPVAGVRLFESKRDRQMAFKFGSGRPEDKPGEAVLDLLREAGYIWKPEYRIWAHPVRPDSAMSTRIEAGWLFEELRHLVRAEKGIPAGQDLPF